MQLAPGGNVIESNTGLFMNILLGIVSAVVASFLFSLIGVSFGGWIGYLVAGFIGAYFDRGRKSNPRMTSGSSAL